MTNTLGSPQACLPRFRCHLAGLAAVLVAMGRPGAALAQDNGSADQSKAFLTDIAALPISDIFLMAVTTGFGIVALIFFLMWRRANSDVRVRMAEDRAKSLRLELDRIESLLTADDQRMIVWHTGTDTVSVTGSLADDIGAPARPASFLAFKDWIADSHIESLNHAVTALRDSGRNFRSNVQTLSGAVVEVTGRTSGQNAVLRFRALDDERTAFARLQIEADRLVHEMSGLQRLIDTLPLPVWMRSDNYRLAWVNSAYVEAVGGDKAETVLSDNLELVDPAIRDAIRKAHRSGLDFDQTLDQDGDAETAALRMIDLKYSGGSIGMIVDQSETDRMRGELEKNLLSTALTFDQLTAAIAVFDGQKRLKFHNAAYRDLWRLDEDFLNQSPEEGALLEHLRANRLLPEKADYRKWQNEHLARYDKPSLAEKWWHLPDGQSLRVVSTPNADGGLSYIFENVTEQLSLESQLKALSHLQGETLDHLNEGVAVFGTNGRLKLYNPAFAKVWQLGQDDLNQEPHVKHIAELCAHLCKESSDWADIMAAMIDLERRGVGRGRLARTDDSAVDYAIVALPEGMTMLTFVDVTDSTRIQNMLSEQNKALEAADRLKTDFIQHVSYELRSPLTSIIGFSEMIADETIGELNERQRDYMDHIAGSSSALLAIINDILDLATFDAGIMVLDFDQVDIHAVAEAATEGLQDRLTEQRINLVTRFADGIGSFEADESRVRQILFNVISNAIRFSEAGSTITLDVSKAKGFVTFEVSDEGYGIPRDLMPNIFKPFEISGDGRGRPGVGLGLSIVKSLAELHGGDIAVQSEEGEGTVVTVHLPEAATAAADAAE